MNSRLAIPLVAGALLLGPLAVAAAQDTAAAQVRPRKTRPRKGMRLRNRPRPRPPRRSPPRLSPAPEVARRARRRPQPRHGRRSRPPLRLCRRSTSRAATLRSLGFVEILTPRPADRIQRAIEEAKVDQRDAETEYSEQQGLESQVKAMVDVKKQEISTLDAQRKLAEKSKQEAEVATFEAEKKDAERHKQFLEKRVSLHQAEKDAARARKNLAEATAEGAGARASARQPAGGAGSCRRHRCRGRRCGTRA